MERRWNLRGQRVQPRVWVPIRLVGDLVHYAHDTSKSRCGRRGSGSDEKKAPVWNNLTIRPGGREPHIRHITRVLISRAGTHSRPPETVLPGWGFITHTNATATAP